MTQHLGARYLLDYKPQFLGCLHLRRPFPELEQDVFPQIALALFERGKTLEYGFACPFTQNQDLDSIGFALARPGNLGGIGSAPTLAYEKPQLVALGGFHAPTVTRNGVCPKNKSSGRYLFG